MIKEHIEQSLANKLKFESTSDQRSLFKALGNFLLPNNADDIILIKGYAGTGKTTALKAFVELLTENKIRSVLLAPTGRAAKVLSNITGHSAFTIHKNIYRQKSSKDGFGEFVLDRNLFKDTFFIVDEVSMISNESFEQSIFGSGHLLDDLIEFVFSGQSCKLILVGDTAQLPPVGLSISPAMEIDTLKNYGLSCAEMELTEVVRQTADSGILHNATCLRNEMPEFRRIRTNSINFQCSEFKDFERITGADLLDNLHDSYSQNKIENTLVICRTNKQANKYNQGIRNSILNMEDEISPGDNLMIVKNNYFWLPDTKQTDFIANGDVAELCKIYNIEEKYGFRFADATIRLLDYSIPDFDVKLLLDTLYVEGPSLAGEDNKKLFYNVLESYRYESTKKKQFLKVKEDPYFNALQIKFAYAVTCHKSQGGQWSHVFVDQGYITEDRINLEYLRWLYTAITRATDKLFLVNFSEKYFPLEF